MIINCYLVLHAEFTVFIHHVIYYDTTCFIAPAVLSSGAFTHPCNVDTLLSIPDNPYGTTLQVETLQLCTQTTAPFNTSNFLHVIFPSRSYIRRIQKHCKHF